MSVSGGENVFPQEVQETLTAHPGVADVAVVGVDDADFGQRLAAFVVLREGAQASADDLRTHVKDHLARYKVPRDVEFVDEIPRNPTGKIVKRLLHPTGA
jgi:fatty-acyl-CoA synthase